MGSQRRFLRLFGELVDVLFHVTPIVGNRSLESFAKANARLPADRLPELGRIGIEASDVDALLLWWPLHECHRTGAGDVQQERDELAVTDWLVAADVEDFAVRGVGGARSQKRISRIVDIHEIPEL